jgi:hypothetical protein
MAMPLQEDAWVPATSMIQVWFEGNQTECISDFPLEIKFHMRLLPQLRDSDGVNAPRWLIYRLTRQG